MKVVCLWSGGKDSCFAAYKAARAGHEIISLVNFTQGGTEYSLSHGLPARVIRRQAESTGMRFTQKAMQPQDYRREFMALMSGYRQRDGIGGIVFGDIYLKEHKEWIDGVCAELKLEPVMPLWGVDTAELAKDFVRAGFRAIVVSVLAGRLGREWLGRQVDERFISDIGALGNIDPCGEKGEFHTFVYDGPLFSAPVRFSPGTSVRRGESWFLNLKSTCGYPGLKTGDCIG